MNENMMFFNKHYIRTDNQSRITTGFSDAFQQSEPTDILINDQGGYQFRLFPNGEENPPLTDEMGIPLFKWDSGHVVERTEAEIQADRDALPVFEPVIPIEVRLDYIEKAIEVIAETLPGEARAKVMSLSSMLDV